ncbi:MULTISPECIES: hypothetical protein [Microbulbifer]|uniref:hypothetical protein n=1 Tax=Microbulbifer TaxID=48073 RepID=UPI001E464EE8|nr:MULTISPECIES: hypothetical protein [Microbulbifer]UHQ54616.1 hypothetical protein LVE68_14060 [Microbulbifer sp. YPW16]
MKSLCLVLTLALLPLAALAQQQETQGEEEKEEVSQEQDAGNVQARAPESNDNEGGVDNYEASEEISEDLSVSYPIDI